MQYQLQLKQGAQIMKLNKLAWIALLLLTGQLAVATEAPLPCEPLTTDSTRLASETQTINLICERAASVDTLEAAMYDLQRQLARQAPTAQDPVVLAQVVALHGLKTECLRQLEQLKLLLEKPTLRLAPTEQLLAQCPVP